MVEPTKYMLTRPDEIFIWDETLLFAMRMHNIISVSFVANNNANFQPAFY